MENEIWKDIKGYEGFYQVSNFGRVKSLNRIIIHGNNTINRNGKVLKPYTSNKGYLVVDLYNGKRFAVKVHRLVGLTFIPNPLNLPQINHKDCNNQNNYVDNLEWCDNSQNQLHAYANGLHEIKYGENSPRGKLTNIQAEEIRALKGKISLRKIGEIYGISHKSVLNIFNNKTYNNGK